MVMAPGTPSSGGAAPIRAVRTPTGDQLPDVEEFFRVFSSLTNQDTDGDGDGINDQREVNYFFKTNALLADSDGDGFEDGQELMTPLSVMGSP